MTKRWCRYCNFNVYECEHTRARVVAPGPRDIYRAAREELKPGGPPLRRGLLVMSADIPSGGECRLDVEPQVTFRPLRFVVAPYMAHLWELDEFTIGHCPQSLGYTGGTMTGDMFPPCPEKGRRVENLRGFQIVHVAMRFMVRVKNVGVQARVFRAYLQGEELPPPKRYDLVSRYPHGGEWQ